MRNGCQASVAILIVQISTLPCKCLWKTAIGATWCLLLGIFKTLEGKENISAMLEATVPEGKPGQWRIEGDANLDRGLIGSWFTEPPQRLGKGWSHPINLRSRLT
jgi:hypothetical protein